MACCLPVSLIVNFVLFCSAYMSSDHRTLQRGRRGYQEPFDHAPRSCLPVTDEPFSQSGYRMSASNPLKALAIILSVLNPTVGAQLLPTTFHGPGPAVNMGRLESARLRILGVRASAFSHTVRDSSLRSKLKMSDIDDGTPPLHDNLSDLGTTPRGSVEEMDKYNPPASTSLAGDQPNFKIRVLAPAEILQVSRLLLDAFAPPEGYNIVQSTLMLPEFALGLRERSEANVQIVAVVADRVVGFLEIYSPAYLASKAGIEFSERVRKSMNPYVASLAVSKMSRRQGVGRALVQAAEAEARRRKWQRLCIEVEESNLAARALYSSRGYVMKKRDTEGRKLVGDIFFGRSQPVIKLWLEKSLEG